MKVLLVTVDTLRADRLGCYGYARPTTPNLDRLASESVLFRDAFTPCSYTVPTHAAILTGRYPGNLSVFFSQDEGEVGADRQVFLQEVLAEEGAQTAAFVSAQVLRGSWGLDAGFRVYDDTPTVAESNRPEALYRPGEDTNDALFAWLDENAGGDFFAWVHYFDVHGPYNAPERYRAMFALEDYGDGPVLLDAAPNGAPGGIPEYQLIDVARDADGSITGYERDAREYLARYDAGVRHEDDVIGALVDKLKSLGVYDETLLIVTADHGEAMGEGGVWFFHGLTVTPEQARVPLLMKLPGGRLGGTSVGGPVSTVDIMPTVLGLAGVDATRFGMDGLPLVGPDGPMQNAGRFVVTENEWQRAVFHGRYCLIKEKPVIRDGFAYYFDSKGLCGGDRLTDLATGAALDGPVDDASGRLTEYADMLSKVSDPKEVSLRLRDNRLAGLERLNKENENAVAVLRREAEGMKAMLAEKDENAAGLEAFIERKTAETDAYIASLLARVGELEAETDRMRVSFSWKVTKPLRWAGERIKGG